MRILVVSQYWHPVNGVPQRRWSWLTSLLTDAGHDVDVIAPEFDRKAKGAFGPGSWMPKRKTYGSSVEIGPSGERIFRTANLFGGQSLTWRALTQAVVALSAFRQGMIQLERDVKPDVIIGTVPAIPTAVVVGALGRLSGKPYIIDLRDAWPDLVMHSKEWNNALTRRSVRERILQLGPMAFISFIVNRSLNRALANAECITVTSERLMCSLQGKFPDKANNNSIYTLRNVFPPKVRTDIGRFELHESGKLNVLYAGTVGRAQNLINFVKALELCRGGSLEINFRVVGDGAGREALLEYARSKGITIEYFPKMKADELESHYKWADTGLVHLTDWEPLERTVPSKTYELMRIGLHITGVAAGETTVLIDSLKAGHTVEPEDPVALARLLKELCLHPEMLAVGPTAQDWVDREQFVEVPEQVRRIIEVVGK